MKLGFNTNVQVGAAVYHVQTEDRGVGHPFIDTVVYDDGRVVHRRTTGYQDLLASGTLTAAALGQRIARQHRGVIEELRAGTLKLDDAVRPEPAGIRIRLLNAASWLKAGIASLEIAVSSRAGELPVEGAAIEVALDGAIGGTLRFGARTDRQGRATVGFALPRLDPAAAALIVRAEDSSGRDELHFHLRPKPRAPAPQTTAQ